MIGALVVANTIVVLEVLVVVEANVLIDTVMLVASVLMADSVAPTFILLVPNTVVATGWVLWVKAGSELIRYEHIFNSKSYEIHIS